MNEMIMRVARAISEADHDCAGDYRKLARAAVEAMREPTEGMVIAADKALLAGNTEDDENAVTWRAMIDAALITEPVS